MNVLKLKVDTPVRRLAAESDYTNGRLGRIVEAEESSGRYRVLWLFEPTGRPIRDGKGLRTWVNYIAVEAADDMCLGCGYHTTRCKMTVACLAAMPAPF